MDEMAKRDDKQMAIFDETGDAFEALAKKNGSNYWTARTIMPLLGYDSWPAFRKVINKAIGVCTATNIDVAENFIKFMVGTQEDFRLTRLSCCLIALNGDSKKTSIANAQMYFVALDQLVQDSLLSPEAMDRIIIREEISEREVTLNKSAKAAGVTEYARFQNAGYRGMYNMDLAELKRVKGIPDIKRSLLDFMGRDELAGNLFRLSLTEARILKENVRGQDQLEDVARRVGARVRAAMIEEAGVYPESLPISADIKTVRKGLKGAGREFTQLDDLGTQRTYEAEEFAQLEAMPTPDHDVECSHCASGDGTSHSGSSQCDSGSIAAGGTVAHCGCAYCSQLSVGDVG
jgi:DNA-damage-inducible protein D